MYAVLNDISAKPDGVNIPDNWPLIKKVIDITTYLSEKYSLDRLRVPHNFESIPIAGSHSINDYRAKYPNDFDIDRLIALESFLANRISMDDAELTEAVSGYNNGTLIDIYIGTQNSTLLAGAYLLKLPALSFQSEARFMAEKLSCNFVSIDTASQITSKPVEIDNIHDTTGYEFHRARLTEIKRQKKFINAEWIATNNPCWNTEIVAEILAQFNYPDCLAELGMQEQRAINMRVAEKILIANGWEEELNVKRLNNSRNEIWRIYKARSSQHEAYISVDLGEGEFEIQDRRGKWVKTVFFDGRDTGKDYSSFKKSNNKQSHNINIR